MAIDLQDFGAVGRKPVLTAEGRSGIDRYNQIINTEWTFNEIA
jgi:hypothetical protein